MLLKTGVDISRLEPPIRKILKDLDRIYRLFCHQELVITSTYEGDHLPSSLHYANLAIDIRKPINVNTLMTQLKDKLKPPYQVIKEETHIHIEYDITSV